MDNIGEMKDQTEEIINLLEKKNWISSYEIFFQSINRFNASMSNTRTEQNLSKQIGFAIRIISKNRRLSEISLNKSLINSLRDLSEPKSTQKIIPIDNFPELKRPRITSIVNDAGKNIDFNHNFLDDLLDAVSEIDNSDISVVNRSLDILQENRIIVNTGSDAIQDVSLKTHYNVAYIKYKDGSIYSSDKSNYSRNLQINFIQLENKVRQSLINNLHFPPKMGSEEIKGVIIEPDILGAILSSLMYIVLSQRSQEIEWKNSLQIYDDPHRAGGYSSTIFDDEGYLTRPKIIVENGVIKNRLIDLQSTNWIFGGNGFRSTWYMPLLRSYKYPINRFFTNLSLHGGIGKGRKFIQRSGTLLTVISGQVSVQGNLNNLQFVIHANETQIWRNGEFIGPGGNITITGNISDLLVDGSISSDSRLVVNQSLPGSVYCGWAYIDAKLVNINWY